MNIAFVKLAKELACKYKSERMRGLDFTFKNDLSKINSRTLRVHKVLKERGITI